MHSFTNLLSRLTSLNEAKDSPMDRIIPGFQSQARALAKSKGASSGTREGRLAMLGILFDLDIIDDSVVRMFKNDPSVSRMVTYFEDNGVAAKIKAKRDEIQSFIKDQLENKVSFTTGNRTDAAQQRYEVNKLNDELKETKKVARLERKKETASAMSTIGQTVDMYDDLIGSMESSYSNKYMLEIVADKDSDLNDITQIVKYISKFVDESDIEVEGRSVDAVFSASSKLGKIIAKIGVEKIERQIADDLKSYGGAGVVIHEPDSNKMEDMIGNLKTPIEDEESYGEEMEEGQASASGFEGLAEDYSNVTLLPNIAQAQKRVVSALGDESTISEKYDMNALKRTGRGIAAAAGIAGAVAAGSHSAEKAYQVGKEVAGSVMGGSTKEFMARLSEPEKAELRKKINELKFASTQAKLSPNTTFGSDYQTVRSELEELINKMRIEHNIPNNISVHYESTHPYTSAYLPEQTKSDTHSKVLIEKSVSFKERYKPKTSYQLEELRRYGL